ncbi:MAG: GntR family transcriptional regulator [Thiotrichales bacterium]|nr:GntR family transcriptional regulator [Thiotrichales bacterium]
MGANSSIPSELQLEMARNILEYVCRRGMNAGTHLTEQELVEEFRVSRSPIRGALSYLAERGVVEQRPNRGFFVKVDSRELRLDRLDLPRTVDEELLVTIAGDWFEKRVPQSFSEAGFRRRYGLGRMTASRILLRLSEDGIITRNRGHGWRFESTLNTKAAHDDSYAFRMVIEPAAIRSPGFELDAGLADLCRHLHETALKPGQEAPSFSTLVNIDATFHRLIGVSSRNRFVQSAIERQNSLRRALEYATWNKARMFDSCLEHMGILDALERGERENAADLMFNHLAAAHDLTTWTEPGDDG